MNFLINLVTSLWRNLFEQTTASLTTAELVRLPGNQTGEQPPPCKRRKGETDVINFLADSDDDEEAGEPAGGEAAATPDDRMIMWRYSS